MVKIVKIHVHEKKRQYYIIEFLKQNGGLDKAEIHEDILVKKGLRKDLEMTDAEYHQLLHLASKNGAFQAAIRYLGFRMRSTKEMQEYLQKKEFDPQIITDTLKRLTNEKLLNDVSYAQAFVRTKMNSTTKGPLVIANELRLKGIGKQDIENALEEYPYEWQYRHAQRFAEKKLKSSHSASYNDSIKKVAVALAQKGFGRDIISEVMQALPQSDPNQEWEVLLAQAAKAEWKYRELDTRERSYKIKSLLYRKGFSINLIDKYLNDYSTQE